MVATVLCDAARDARTVGQRTLGNGEAPRVCSTENSYIEKKADLIVNIVRH